MEENKKSEKTNEAINKSDKEATNVEPTNMHQKVYWIIGIALIIFLLFLFGSLIILRITENTANNAANGLNKLQNQKGEEVNYEIINEEHGIKRNASENIEDAEFDINGLRLSHVRITEFGDTTDITIEVGNISSETVAPQEFNVKFYDSKNQLLVELPITTEEIPIETITMVHTMTEKSCVNATRVEIEAAK